MEVGGSAGDPGAAVASEVHSPMVSECESVLQAGFDPVADYLAVCRAMTRYLHVGVRVGTTSLDGRTVPAAVVAIDGMQVVGRRKKQGEAVSGGDDGKGMIREHGLEVAVPVAQPGHSLRPFWFRQMRALGQVPGLIGGLGRSASLTSSSSLSTGTASAGARASLLNGTSEVATAAPFPAPTVEAFNEVIRQATESLAAPTSAGSPVEFPDAKLGLRVQEEVVHHDASNASGSLIFVTEITKGDLLKKVRQGSFVAGVNGQSPPRGLSELKA